MQTDHRSDGPQFPYLWFRLTRKEIETFQRVLEEVEYANDHAKLLIESDEQKLLDELYKKCQDYRLNYI